MQPDQNNRAQSIKIFLIMMNSVVMLFIAVASIISIRSFIADWNIIPSQSMNPTIAEGDQILVNQ